MAVTSVRLGYSKLGEADIGRAEARPTFSYCANENVQGAVWTKFRLLFAASSAFLSASWYARADEPSDVEAFVPRGAFASARTVLTVA